jgi:hypothetical protein
MYCQSCDIEVPVENQQNCPFCDAVLIENSTSYTETENTDSEDDFQVDALIQEINSNLQQSLEREDGNAKRDSTDNHLSGLPEDNFDSDLNAEMVKPENVYNETNDFKLAPDENEAIPEISLELETVSHSAGGQSIISVLRRDRKY